jgi:uncharacterized protein (DUF305 family)
MRFALRRRAPLLALLTAAVLAVALVLLTTLPSGDGASAADDPGHDHPAPTASPKRTLSERAFLDLMIPHHEMAVEMAEIANEKSANVDVMDVATDVLTQQPWEIKLMAKWRKDWFGVAPDARRAMTEAEMRRYGMQHDMAKLEAAKPFPAAFFRAMIPHHQGGITMARELLRTKPRPPIARLARSIIVSQGQDIGRMKRFLRGEGWAAPQPSTGKPPVTP